MNSKSYYCMAKITLAILISTLCGSCTKHQVNSFIVKINSSKSIFTGADFEVLGADPDSDLHMILVGADAKGNLTCSWATFTSLGSDPFYANQNAPDAGSYSGKDRAGLFWSRRSCDVLPKPLMSIYEKWPIDLERPNTLGSFSLLAYQNGHTFAQNFELPLWGFENTKPSIDIIENSLELKLFLPIADKGNKLVVWIGGSGGDYSIFAARTANLGFSSASISYFGTKNTNDCLNLISIDEVSDHINSTIDKYDYESVIIVGVSRGAEIASLIANDVDADALALVAPLSNFASGSISPSCSGESAWMHRGKKVPGLPGDLSISDTSKIGEHQENYVSQFIEKTKPQSAALLRLAYIIAHPAIDQRTRIPIDDYPRSVRIFVGDDDQVTGLWSAKRMHNWHKLTSKCESKLIVYENAGHQIMGSEFTVSESPVQYSNGNLVNSGGTREGNANARRQLWQDLVAYFSDVSPQQHC